MARDYTNLSHHESLRLDYLQKNIHFLNQREAQELAYLQDKLAGRLIVPSTPLNHGENHTPEGLPRFSAKGRSAASHEQVALHEPEQDESASTPEGLPKFKQRARQKRSAKVPKQKPKLSRGKKIKRILLSFLLLFIALLASMVFLFFKGYNATKSNEATAQAAEVEVFNGQETRDGINILVLGTDERTGQDSSEARTDSIMVVNIGNSDKKVKIVSFMRDTLINIPGYSYEDGYNTYYDQKLNAAFSYGEMNNKQGAEAIRVALKQHFDIDIQYYAMVDFSTFAVAVDTLFPDGVKIDAKFSTVDGVAVDSVDVPDDLNAQDGVVPNQTIEVGEQYMDGRTLLNYARFRKDDEGDSGRVRRQQEVLSAILQQVKNPVKLFTGSEALGKIMGMTSTNIPYSFILSKGISVLGDASNGMEHLTVPEMGDWVDEYDAYGGLGLYINFETYQQRLAELGFR